MRWWHGWRVALRIARRDALRAKGRSLLIIAMIALPIVGAVAADLTLRSAELSTSERLLRELGQSDARLIDRGSGAPLLQEPLDPAGASYASDPTRTAADEPVPLAELLPRAELFEDTVVHGVGVATAHGRMDVSVRELDAAQPALSGMLTLLRGDFPGGPAEVAVTEEFLRASGLKVGSALEFRYAEGEYRITGVYETPSELGAQQLLVIPRGLAGELREDRDHYTETSYLAQLDGGLSWAEITELNQHGWIATSRAVVLDPPPAEDVPYYQYAEPFSAQTLTAESRLVLLAAVALVVVEICLLAGPAFAVGARRSRRMLGLLGAGGGDRRHIRAVMLSSGMVLGAAAAVLGTALGALTVLLAQPWLEGLAGQRFESLTVRPLEILAICGLAVLIGVVAALIPAELAARTPVLESLTGRRGVRRAGRLLPVVGGLAVPCGVTVALLGAFTLRSEITVAGGAILAQFGLVALTPVLVGACGGLGRWLPLSGRLALRDAVRNRPRTAPAVAAVLAAVSGTIAVATGIGSEEQRQRAEYTASVPDGTVVLVSAGGGALDGARQAAERELPTTARADLARVAPGASVCAAWDTTDTDCGAVRVRLPHTEDCADSAGDERIGAACSWHEVVGPDLDQEVVIGGADVLRLLDLADPVSLAAVERGEAVVFDPSYLDADGQVTLEVYEVLPGPQGEPGSTTPVSAPHPDPDPDADADPHRVGGPDPAADLAVPDQVVSVPGVAGGEQFAENGTRGVAKVLLPPSAARDAGLATSEYATFYATSQPPTEAEHQAFLGAMDQLSAPPQEAVERGFQSDTGWVLLVLALIAGVVTLGAAGIATGLAQADADADLSTLAAVGAPPRVRRTLSGLQCLVVAAIGVVLGVVSGLIPGVGLVIAGYQRELAQWEGGSPLTVGQPELVVALPWGPIVLLLVVIPLVAGLVAALLTRSRVPLARRVG